MKKGKLDVLRNLAATMPVVEGVNHMKRLRAAWQKDKSKGVMAYCTDVYIKDLLKSKL